MRLLPERTDHDGEGNAGQESTSHRRADPRNHEPNLVPLHDLLPGSDRHQTRCQDTRRDFARFQEGGGGMSATDKIPQQIESVLLTHRRGFLKSAGLLAVSFGAFSLTDADAQISAAPQGPGPYRDPDFHQID